MLNSLSFQIIYISYSILIAFLLFYISVNKFEHIKSFTKSNITSERWAVQTKPIIGGVIFYIMFFLFFFQLNILDDSKSIYSSEFIGIFITVSLSFLMGLFDDIKSYSPLFKFAVQLICSIILIFCGIYFTIFQSTFLNYIITVLWVVAIMNSFNMLDNMDAITGSVSLVIMLSIYLLISLHGGEIYYKYLILTIIVSLLAFLYWNWNPSKIYMGDNGSQFIGIIISILSIKFLWIGNSQTISHFVDLKSLSIGMLVFIVPLADTFSVTVNRIARGVSPFVGGRDHTTHNLSYLGLSDRKVAWVFIVFAVLTNIIAVIIAEFIDNYNIYYFFISLFIVIVILCIFYSFTIFGKKKSNVQIQ